MGFSRRRVLGRRVHPGCLLTLYTRTVTDDPTEVTRLLRSAREGDDGAVEQLIEAVYADLKALGKRHLDGERAGHTLQPTALVHEAYLKLLQQEQVDWQDRAHFFAIAGRLIRRILVDRARARGRLKRGGGQQRETLSGVVLEADGLQSDLVALDEALSALAEEDPVAAQVVELRFFADQTHAEIAQVLGIGERTVRRHFAYAKAWLFRFLSRGEVSG